MNFDLHNCPLCGAIKDLDKKMPTLWLCKKCGVFIEVIKSTYRVKSSNKSEIRLIMEIVRVDADLERDIRRE